MKYSPPRDFPAEFDAQDIIKLADMFFHDQLLPDLMSEPMPQAPSHWSLGIEAFNVDSFQDLLENKGQTEGQDVFVFFDSPVCFSCPEFYPLFEKLAESKTGLEHLTFGYVDMGKNELQKIAEVY